MNCRQKLLNVFNFNTNGPIPLWEFAYWYDTIQRWYDEGLPKRIPVKMLSYNQFIGAEAFSNEEHDVHDYFDFDGGIQSLPINTDFIPEFEEKQLAEDTENVLIQDSNGIVWKAKKNATSMPQFISHPVKKEDDFKKIKERIDPDSPGRFPNNWDKKIKEYNHRDFPLQLGGKMFCGFYSTLRELMGTEESLIAFYDKPDFVHNILQYCTDYIIRLYVKALQNTEINIDYVQIPEDLACKNAPLFSPYIFKEFLFPYYKRLISKMKEFGIKHFIIDTDGNFEVLIPLFLECGITGLYPWEVQAGLDIERIRNEYPKLIIMGGVNKMALAQGKDAIDKEISKVERMLGKGGYLPFTDHAVPPDVSFENYRYFRDRLKAIIRC